MLPQVPCSHIQHHLNGCPSHETTREGLLAEGEEGTAIKKGRQKMRMSDDSRMRSDRMQASSTSREGPRLAEHFGEGRGGGQLVDLILLFFFSLTSSTSSRPQPTSHLRLRATLPPITTMVSRRLAASPPSKRFQELALSLTAFSPPTGRLPHPTSSPCTIFSPCRRQRGSPAHTFAPRRFDDGWRRRLVHAHHEHKWHGCSASYRYRLQPASHLPGSRGREADRSSFRQEGRLEGVGQGRGEGPCVAGWNAAQG